MRMACVYACGEMPIRQQICGYSSKLQSIKTFHFLSHANISKDAFFKVALTHLPAVSISPSLSSPWFRHILISTTAFFHLYPWDTTFKFWIINWIFQFLEVSVAENEFILYKHLWAIFKWETTGIVTLSRHFKIDIGHSMIAISNFFHSWLI